MASSTPRPKTIADIPKTLRRKRRRLSHLVVHDGAAEQGNEADEAQELMMLDDGLSVINVRFAAYCRCYVDVTRP